MREQWWGAARVGWSLLYLSVVLPACPFAHLSLLTLSLSKSLACPPFRSLHTLWLTHSL